MQVIDSVWLLSLFLRSRFFLRVYLKNRLMSLVFLTSNLIAYLSNRNVEPLQILTIEYHVASTLSGKFHYVSTQMLRRWKGYCFFGYDDYYSFPFDLHSKKTRYRPFILVASHYVVGKYSRPLKRHIHSTRYVCQFKKIYYLST